MWIPQGVELIKRPRAINKRIWGIEIGNSSSRIKKFLELDN